MNWKKLILSLLVFMTTSVIAQPPLDWVSAGTVGGGFQDYVEDVYVDAAGNTYACGSFRGSLTFGSDNLFANSAGQVFVVKYNSAGTPLWAIQSNGDSQAFAKSIFVDNTGHVYVGGYHSHSVISFAGLSIPSSSNEGFYILKISPSGTPLHLTGPTFPSTGKSQAWGITGDQDFLYITGLHKGALSLPGGPSLPATVGLSDMFVAKIDSAFASFDYAFSHGSTAIDKGTSIAQNGTDFFVTGYYGDAPCTFIAPGPDYVLPNYGQEAMFVTSFDIATGDVNWSSSGGTAVGPSRGNDILASGPFVFLTGACSDSTTFVQSPSPSGPFTYNDTLFSAGGTDIFVCRYNVSGNLQADWREGGIEDDEAFGITLSSVCSEIEICGYFQDSVNFGGTTPYTANGKDIFISSYTSAGLFKWTTREISTGDEIAYSIHSNGNRSSVGGELNSDTYFNTVPQTQVNWNGFNDHFVTSFQCATVPPCGPSITTCVENDTVIADGACAHVLGNYTSGLVVNDGCLSGITVTQFPPPLNILGAGTHEIKLTATDGGGNTDICIFNLFVEANSGPTIAACGDQFTAETTGGTGNDFNSFSCTSINTPGQDVLYQITVDAGNHFLQVKMDNAVDSNDPYAYVYWLGSSCPNTGVCSEVDSFDVNTDQFSNNSKYLTFIANGPGTYFLVVDAKTDSIESFDIEFVCTSSGIEFDNSSCVIADADSDGIVAQVNGSTADLSMQPCESVSICHDLYIANIYDWEWVDSVNFNLGDCYENINVLTLSPNAPPNDNGFYDSFGEWVANYDGGTNEITWEFTHSSTNPWGDGNTGQYGCQDYTFCFDAEITSTCANSEGLNIGIAIGDDGGKGQGTPSNLFDIGNSNDFILNDDNPFFSYSTNILCNGDPDFLPDSITTSGGMFTSTAGLVFTDGSPSPTGEIDLTASSIGGPYTITHTVGLCPFTQDFIVSIFAQDDPSFNYSAAAYCQGDTDPTATITGTGGGMFMGPPEIIFLDNLTGEIDLDASTAGGPYWITYTTPGPNCINIDSVQVTINPEDDPTFSFASIDHCADDANVIPTSITTLGGTFSEYTSNLNVNAASGEVDIMASPVGNYYVVYTTSGICPNVDSVEFNILTEDITSFTYPASQYCQNESNPLPTISGTAGGQFASLSPISFVTSSSGEINLLGSTAGGPYWVTYTTPGPSCPNADSVQITIHAEDDSTFDYPSSILCFADSNPLPNISGTSGGTFIATPAGLIFTDGSPSPTGEIDITASTIGGPYTITYTTPGPQCPNSMDYVLSIFAEDDPTISYPSASYCQNETNPIPTVVDAGGTFTGAVSFVDINSGEINLSASTTGGPFEIVYTTAGPECPNTDTAYVTINALDDPTFSYADTAFCDADLIAVPTISGTGGGLFNTVDTSLLSLDTLSGEINLVTSTAGGPYTIEYVTTGICPDSSNFEVTIFTNPTSNAGPDQTLFLDYETNLEAISPTIGTGLWSIISGAGNLADETDSTSLIDGLEEGSTTLEWQVSNGVCPIAIDEVIITVSNLFIPEGFTPNGDGLNDYFVIDGIESLEHNIEIFNRWGQKVFESTNYLNDWDGTNEKGEELVNDTYFYVITADELKFKGFIVLKR